MEIDWNESDCSPSFFSFVMSKRSPVFRQDEVGFSREAAVERAIDREAVAHAVKHRPQCQFRLRVPAADAGHDLGWVKAEMLKC